ncbi:unnamed protein product, partial [Schistosoma intercalatum]
YLKFLSMMVVHIIVIHFDEYIICLINQVFLLLFVELIYMKMVLRNYPKKM